MNRRFIPVVVAVSALIGASCGGSDGSSPDSGTVTATTVLAEDRATASTDAPPPPPTATPSTTAPDAGPGTLPNNTGSELQWDEVATDVDVPPGELLWTGSSFIIAGHDDTGATFLRSSDGVDWAPLSNLPDQVDWFGIHAADESIVVWGTDTLADQPDGDSGFEQMGPGLPPEDVRVIASTDGGATWVELDRLTAQSELSASPYLRAASSFSAAATKGDIVFVSVEAFVELDFELVLADNGIDRARLADGWRTDDGMTICLFPVGFDPANEGDESDAVPADEDFGGDEGDAVPANEGFGDDEGFDGEQSCEGAEGVEGIEQLDITFEQLGLDEADIAAIDMGFRSFQILRSLDGGPFEAAEVDPPFDDWHPGWLRVVDREFVASLTNESGDTLVYRSADALEWEHGDPINAYIDGVTTDGVSLFAQSYSDEGPVFIRSDDAGRTWTDFAVPEVGGGEVFIVSAGPAGFAVLGAFMSEPSVEEPSELVIEKDGYRLTITDDDETIVSDLDTGETVLYLGPDERESEFVIEDENGITLLDQETLETLVTITWGDFEEAFNEAYGEPSEPELFVGWSADGEHWGWQFTVEAFGANGGAQFAVGDGAVVAMHQDFDEGMSVVRVFTALVG